MRALCIVFLLVHQALHGQVGTAHFGGMDLHDGIYADFTAFRTNRPMAPLGKLRDAQGNGVDDLRRVRGKLSWMPDSGALRTVDLRDVWGFCQNDVVYIRSQEGFFRIGLMGSLSHLVVEQTYRDWDPYLYGYPTGGVSRTVLMQQLLDMRTGACLPFNASTMDQALLHDTVLSEEFRNLPKKQRNSQEALFRFLRLYNDRHPLVFPG